MKKIIALCALLAGCGPAPQYHDAKPGYTDGDYPEPVRLRAIAPDGTHLWSIGCCDSERTVYFASSGSQSAFDVHLGKSTHTIVRHIPTGPLQ